MAAHSGDATHRWGWEGRAHYGWEPWIWRLGFAHHCRPPNLKSSFWNCVKLSVCQCWWMCAADQKDWLHMCSSQTNPMLTSSPEWLKAADHPNVIDQDLPYSAETSTMFLYFICWWIYMLSSWSFSIVSAKLESYCSGASEWSIVWTSVSYGKQFGELL